MKQKLKELEEIDKFTIIVGDFNTPLSKTDGTISQKISKAIKELNANNQQDLVNIYRILHPITAKYTFIKCSWTYTKIDHFLSHKTILTQKKQNHTKYVVQA